VDHGSVMHARTEEHIRTHAGRTAVDASPFVCGCEWRLVGGVARRRWFLCSYHEGFDDALTEDATP
jgi:hypothetical protein